jgi:hypothetical protein
VRQADAKDQLNHTIARNIMKSTKWNVSTTTRARTKAVALVCAVVTVVAEAKASDYEECSQILAQDIFNKITRSDSSSSASSAEAKAAFFQQSESQAFDAYSKAFDEAKKNGTKIDAEGHYGIIGGEVGIDVTSDKKVSESEFNSKFKKAQDTYRSSISSKSASNQDLMSNYASYVRDPGTVNAWKECVSRTRETNLYAFASRDRAGKMYVNVMWVPGALAGSVPSIPIGFVTGGGEMEGIRIHAKAEEQLAMGSGRNFAVSCGKRCDEGFQVTVNGTLRNARGVATSSFTTTVEVPPSKPPAPPECPWEGDWDTEWTWGDNNRASAPLTFARNGEGLSGTTRYGNLVLSGNGKTVAGQWFNTTGTAGKGCQDGTVRFVKTGCSFEGLWNFCAEAPKLWWRGTKRH